MCSKCVFVCLAHKSTRRVFAQMSFRGQWLTCKSRWYYCLYLMYLQLRWLGFHSYLTNKHTHTNARTHRSCRRTHTLTHTTRDWRIPNSSKPYKRSLTINVVFYTEQNNCFCLAMLSATYVGVIEQYYSDVSLNPHSPRSAEQLNPHRWGWWLT